MQSMAEIGSVGYEGDVHYVKTLQTGRWTDDGQKEIKHIKSCTARNNHVDARLHQRIGHFFYLTY